MERNTLSKHGPQFSRIIAGAWRWQSLTQPELEVIVRHAIDHGITAFDHADVYGNYACEELFGNVLRANPSIRSKIELVSKCGIKLVSKKRPQHAIKHYDTSYNHVVASVENSLRALHTDYLDLLLMHRPDPLMDSAELSKAFNDLKQSGKVLHFGVSNFTTSQFELLQKYTEYSLVTNQIELSLFNPQPFFDGTVDTLMKYHVSPMAWSPLSGGKYFNEETSMGRALIQNAHRLCEKYGTTAPQLLLAWLCLHPAKVFPIVGTSKPERLTEAVHASQIKLERQDWFEMLKWSTGKDVA
jgi:predicted oxidoreductase